MWDKNSKLLLVKNSSFVISRHNFRDFKVFVVSGRFLKPEKASKMPSENKPSGDLNVMPKTAHRNPKSKL